MSDPILSASNIEKAYAVDGGKVEILRGVSLTLATGETLALTGESGSGKSTLLHLLAGLDMPDAGQIDIAGQNLTAMDDTARAALRRGTVGLVFQQFNLIPSLDVASNIAFHARLSDQHDASFGAHLAERLGLADQLRKYPEALSGGQQQRVAIARTLAARPKIILADEPTGNLDEAASETVLSLLHDLVVETRAALITVTHSQAVAEAMSRRLHLTGGRVA